MCLLEGDFARGTGNCYYLFIYDVFNIVDKTFSVYGTTTNLD